ncbi:circadian clock-controlled protein daywake-like [Pieris brassicae]|uniref:circadian clock-controlled protein daywake-like n=1 Tax=Pieris brassicae TaxID=7116 RepID=UPI001E660D1B|nr:circadian clock-controlled protein daywake-like [Pieris brassicae]
MLGVIVFFLAVWSVTPLGLPDYLKSCSRNDQYLNECALKSAQDSIRQFSLGDPARDLPSLDPLYIPEMKVYIPDEKGLKILFKNNYFKGLSKLQHGLKFDLDKKLIVADALVNLDVKNEYEVSGKILLLAIRSSGDASIRLKKTLLRIQIWYEHALQDEKIHWNITKHDVKYEVEKAVFRLENLLNDKNIGDQINKLINEMWREVVADVGPSICESLTASVVRNVAILLKQVPYDQLMPE